MAGLRNRSLVVRVAPVSALVLGAAAVLTLLLAPHMARRIAGGAVSLLPREREFAVATAGAKGAYYRLGVLLSDTLARETRYRLEVVETAGSIENLACLKAGRCQFAFIQGGLDVDLSGVQTVSALDRQYVHIVVPADSEIRTFRDLAGRRVGVGPADSGFEALGKLVFSYFDFANAPELVTDHGPDLARAFLDGQLDAAFTVYALFTPAMEELLATGFYRLVPIPDAPAAARFLPGIQAETLPPSLYGPDRSLPAAGFPTLAVDTLLVARSDAPGPAVQALLEALEGPAFLRGAHLEMPPARERLDAVRIPIHPAAAAYYGRNDPISSDAFEIASFFLGGLLGLVSLTHYLLGRAREREKNRKRRAIRPYFETLLAFGTDVEASQDTAELSQLIHEMMGVQRGAERAWLAGDLDTEDMENLYAVYGIRSANAFRKIQNLLLVPRSTDPDAEPPKTADRASHSFGPDAPRLSKVRKPSSQRESTAPESARNEAISAPKMAKEEAISPIIAAEREFEAATPPFGKEKPAEDEPASSASEEEESSRPGDPEIRHSRADAAPVADLRVTEEKVSRKRRPKGDPDQMPLF